MSAGWNKKLTLMDIEHLFKEMKEELHHYIAKKVNNQADVQDILHNVFLKVIEKGDTLQDRDKVRGWIYTITRNTIIDFYRKNKYLVYNGQLDEGINIAQEIRNYRKFSDELNKCLKTAIDELPEKYREIIYLTEVEGIKQKDLAEQLNMAYPTLRSRVQRGREKLTLLMRNNCKYQRGYCEFLNTLDRNGCGICGNITPVKKSIDNV